MYKQSSSLSCSLSLQNPFSIQKLRARSKRFLKIHLCWLTSFEQTIYIKKCQEEYNSFILLFYRLEYCFRLKFTFNVTLGSIWREYMNEEFNYLCINLKSHTIRVWIFYRVAIAYCFCTSVDLVPCPPIHVKIQIVHMFLQHSNIGRICHQ